MNCRTSLYSTQMYCRTVRTRDTEGEKEKNEGVTHADASCDGRREADAATASFFNSTDILLLLFLIPADVDDLASDAQHHHSHHDEGDDDDHHHLV